MTIKAFLLARLDEEIRVDAAGIRREIERHDDRTMVVSGGARGVGYVTRCGVCANEYTSPCRALKSMARDYEDHPDFDATWR